MKKAVFIRQTPEELYIIYDDNSKEYLLSDRINDFVKDEKDWNISNAIHYLIKEYRLKDDSKKIDSKKGEDLPFPHNLDYIKPTATDENDNDGDKELTEEELNLKFTKGAKKFIKEQGLNINELAEELKAVERVTLSALKKYLANK